MSSPSTARPENLTAVQYAFNAVPVIITMPQLKLPAITNARVVRGLVRERQPAPNVRKEPLNSTYQLQTLRRIQSVILVATSVMLLRLRSAHCVRRVSIQEMSLWHQVSAEVAWHAPLGTQPVVLSPLPDAHSAQQASETLTAHNVQPAGHPPI